MPLEFLGRITATDAQHMGAACALLAWVMLVRAHHRRSPLPWVTAAAAAASRCVAAARRHAVVLGIDLVAQPPVPARLPPVALVPVATTTVLVVAAALVPGLDAALLVAALRTVSGLLWLAAFAAFTVLAFAAGASLLFLAVRLHRDTCIRAHTGPGPRPLARDHTVTVLLPLGCVAAVGFLPPTAVVLPLTLVVAVLLVGLHLPATPEVTLLWRPAAGGPVRSIGWRTQLLAGAGTLALLGTLPGLLLRERPSVAVLIETGPLPLAVTAATLLSWSTLAFFTLWSRLLLVEARDGRRIERAGRLPRRVRILPPVDRAVARDALRDLAALPLRGEVGPAWPRHPAMPLRIDPDAPPRDPWARASGPPVLRPADLRTPGTARFLERRTEFHLRRLVLKGIEAAFRAAGRRTFRNGCGFWVAPHLWSNLALTRDEEEEVRDHPDATFLVDTIGPAWRGLMAPEVRAHVRDLLVRLDLHLIFVEDGIPFRKFRRVLLRLFETADRIDRPGRAEERHFTGIPGVRVLIHDFDLARPLAPAPNYPEPDYEDVGRARILHVFRDRGEAEEPVDAPRDRKDEPLLVS